MEEKNNKKEKTESVDKAAKKQEKLDGKTADKQKKLDEKLEKKRKKAEQKERDKARIREEKRLDREERFRIDNPIKFMRIITVIGCIVGVLGVFLLTKYIVNTVFLIKYDNAEYAEGLEEFLQFVNIPEGYLPHYNAGNAYYMEKDYDMAIAEYEAALEAHPSEKKECDIRVNLALAMLQKIDFDNLNTEKQKQNAIRQLQAARNVLCLKGCADPYGTDGHDPEAEQLKQDIDKMLEELGAEPEPPQDDSDQSDQQNGGGESEEKKQTRREKQLEEDLKNQKQESNQERQEYQDKHPKDEEDGGDKTGSGGGDDGYGGSGEDDDDTKTW